MEEYTIILDNINKYTLKIGEERPYYKREGINQLVEIYLDNDVIYSSTFSRYDLLYRINKQEYITFNDFFMGFPTLIIDKKSKKINISSDGFDYNIIDNDNYDIFLKWLINSLKTKSMKRKDKINKILKYGN